MNTPNHITIRHDATDEEAAIIVAAVEAMWPKPVILLPGVSAADPQSAWRFSGRWWTKPVSQRRDRPSFR